MLSENAIAAHDEYRKQLQTAFTNLSKAEQKSARAGEGFLLSAVTLADSLVKWGEMALEALQSEDDLDLPDSQIRTMVTVFAGTVADFLRQAVETDDDYSTRAFCEQAKKVADILNVVQRSWHWADMTTIEESWHQYRRGELMDFETFKNELLRAEE